MSKPKQTSVQLQFRPSVARLWFVLPCRLETALAPNIFEQCGPRPSPTEAQALSPRDDPSLLVSCKPLKVHVSIRYSMSSGTRDWGSKLLATFWIFCSCKFIIFGRSTAKADHCNSPSCILFRETSLTSQAAFTCCISARTAWEHSRFSMSRVNELSTYSPCLTLLLNAMG